MRAAGKQGVAGMWVFGYGSLMWDGWERSRRCVRKGRAKLPGFRRAFNKASVRNWGSTECPGPTLNFVRDDDGVCEGIAFEFSDADADAVLAYLRGREGQNFHLEELEIETEGGIETKAFLPVYRGANIIDGKTPGELAEMARTATGSDGRCVEYVQNIAGSTRDQDAQIPGALTTCPTADSVSQESTISFAATDIVQRSSLPAHFPVQRTGVKHNRQPVSGLRKAYRGQRGEWSGRRESNPYGQLGRLEFYH